MRNELYLFLLYYIMTKVSPMQSIPNVFINHYDNVHTSMYMHVMCFL